MIDDLRCSAAKSFDKSGKADTVQIDTWDAEQS